MGFPMLAVLGTAGLQQILDNPLLILVVRSNPLPGKHALLTLHNHQMIFSLHSHISIVELTS